MRIGILQCGQSPDVLKPEMGDYPDMFIRLLADRGLEFRTWHVEELQFPTDIHQAQGWLITGSRHGAYEDHAFIPPLEVFIREAYDAGVPLVGICFGHQIIAQALGGTVIKHPGGWAVGAQDYDFQGETVTLNAWHQDQVTELPEDAKVVATHPFCENAALVYGDRAFTVQAHPEFTDAFVEGLMQFRGPGRVPDEQMAAARNRMGQAEAGSMVLADRIAAFFLQSQTEDAA